MGLVGGGTHVPLGWFVFLGFGCLCGIVWVAGH